MTRREFTPHAYQRHIIEHILATPRGNVWAGMGLGKTVSALTAIDALYLMGEMSKPVLVLAPLRVARNTWPAEALKWSHLRHVEVEAIVGDAKQREVVLQRALRQGNTSVYTTNYDNLPWLVKRLEELRRPWPFGMVIADESTRLKSFRTRQGGARTKALAQHAHKGVDRWVNLTGTPSPNGLEDLWGQNWFIDRGERLGRSFSAFQQRWFQAVPIGATGFTKTVPLAHAQAQVQEALADVSLSLDARDWFDLEEPISRTVQIELPPRARAMYRQMEREMFMEISGHEVEAFNAAAKTMRLLQLSAGACYVDPTATHDEQPAARQWVEIHDAKIQALESLVQEAAGMPVLVAYHFKSDLARILKAFPKARWLDTDPQTEADWNAGKIPMLVASPKSAGHGLSLQDGGNILAFFSHDWNLEEYQQIIERIGPTRQRQAGHDRPVYLYHIVATDTIDEVVMKRRESKREVQDLLLEAMRKRA